MRHLMTLRISLLSVLFVVVTSSAAYAQSAVRVKKDETVIWQSGFFIPALVVKAGTILEVVNRQGEWYEVVLPNVVVPGRTTGFIAVSQVDPVDNAPIPQRRPAPAEPPDQRSSRPTVKPKPGFRAYAIVEAERMLANDSFEALVGKSTLFNVGFGAEATGLHQGLFVRGAATHTSVSGSRVVVDSSKKVYSLHIPLTIEITPIEISTGWRATVKQGDRVVPYVGAGLLLQRYKETSTPSIDADTNTTDVGMTLFAGAEISVKFIRILIEGQYRTVPKTLGTAGVSEDFGEKNLGGGVLRLGFGVGL
jgi:opacity protein-like surface antigen